MNVGRGASSRYLSPPGNSSASLFKGWVEVLGVPQILHSDCRAPKVSWMTMFGKGGELKN